MTFRAFIDILSQIMAEMWKNIPGLKLANDVYAGLPKGLWQSEPVSVAKTSIVREAPKMTEAEILSRLLKPSFQPIVRQMISSGNNSSTSVDIASALQAKYGPDFTTSKRINMALQDAEKAKLVQKLEITEGICWRLTPEALMVGAKTFGNISKSS